MEHRYAVILCGGSGTRLWPLSRSLKPKHLLALNGDNTLLQQTALRVCKNLSASHLITVTHESHRFEVKGQLADILPDAVNGVIAEPIAKNTLPAIAIAVKHIYTIDPNAIVGVFASDHAIDNEAAFIAAWDAAELAAEAGYLTLLGIKPTESATGYGYIKPGTSLGLYQSKLPVLSVSSFVEKPDLENAEKFVEAGYLWNSGMFVFRADTFMQLLARYQPAISAVVLGLNEENIEEQYYTLPSLSIDHGLVELADQVAVVPVDMAWSDLGNWESVYQRHGKDANNNVIRGDVVSVNTQNSLLWSQAGVLTTLGVSNLIVIKTADATLICDRNCTEDVKLVVSEVKDRYATMAETHLTVQRPWGSYCVLEEGPHFKIKRIVVKPNARLSLQTHQHRSEHWVVVSGVATVIKGSQELVVSTNESTYIPLGCKHRLSNLTDKDLVIIEVQTGHYLDESDIVRYDDIYGRLN
jgi:mannose-1-phosphate guanylyltransferase / mannose-6-phosphate isomerase